MPRTLTLLLVAAGFSLSFAFCTAVDPICLDPIDLDPTSSNTGQSHSLSFTFTWDSQGLSENPGGGWEVHTDLGYTVRWAVGYVVTLRGELVPCDAEGTELDTCAQILGWLTSPSVARAGHGDGEPDPSRTTVGEVESLVDLAPLDVAGPSLDGPAYCTTHYLISRAYGFTNNLPTDIDMIGRSLYIAGEYRAPESETWVPYVASTSVNNGRLASLASAADGRTPPWIA